MPAREEKPRKRKTKNRCKKWPVLNTPKSLMRMLGPAGNPRADNLFEVVSFLQQREKVRFQVKTAPLPSLMRIPSPP
jgi:hypothetical protein